MIQIIIQQTDKKKTPIGPIQSKFSTIMANLKNDLDEYLLLQSDQKKSFKIDMKMPTIKVPEIKNLFGKSEPQEANSWLKDTQESCCPKLVRRRPNSEVRNYLIIPIFLFAIISHVFNESLDL